MIFRDRSQRNRVLGKELDEHSDIQSETSKFEAQDNSLPASQNSANYNPIDNTFHSANVVLPYFFCI